MGTVRMLSLMFTPPPSEHTVEGTVEEESIGHGTYEQLQLKESGENELLRVEEASNTISSPILTNRFPPDTITLGGDDVTFTDHVAAFDTTWLPVNDSEKVYRWPADTIPEGMEMKEEPEGRLERKPLIVE